jgi:hypothetical protein
MSHFVRSLSALILPALCCSLSAGCGDDGSGESGVGGSLATGGSESGGGSGGSATAGGGSEAAAAGQGPVGSGGQSGELPPTLDCAQAPADECPFANGLQYACKQRFALGMNYAWHNFGGDFGGIPAWGQLGVSGALETYDAELAAMRDNGASVIRWWMFPELRGGGVQLDANGDASGLSELAVLDIAKALELANANDLYVVLTLFSFDNFRPDRTVESLPIPGLTAMVTDPTRRARLIENVARPAARAVAASPHASRLLGWDVINEPEWAVAPVGAAAEGGQDFDPNDDLAPVTLAEMKALINETLAALKEETPHALRSVGWAAAKWQWAFEDVTEVEFHQPHIYAWVNDYWPYTQSPAELGYTGKPTVMGEFALGEMPLAGSSEATFDAIIESWMTSGYAGAWAWQHFDGAANLPVLAAVADSKGCEVSY